MKNNKKGQYHQNGSYMNVHPVLVIGIALFILPFLLSVITNIGNVFSSILQGAGIIFILIGGAFSIFKASNR